MRLLPAFALVACLLAGPVHATGVAFQQVDKYFAGENLYDVEAADLDGDGDLDLVSASVGANVVSVRLNDGSGRFVPGASYTSAAPITVALADFDRDGKVDMAVGEFFGDYVILRRGLGDGTFGPSFEAPFTGGPRDLKFADLDGDGFLDLAAARGDRVFLFRGDGAGGFADPTPVVVGGVLKAISVGDLDGDGRPDLAAVDYNGKRVVPIRNQGGFAFTTLPPLAAATGASDVALADFDGDGDLDIAITNENGSAMVYQNSGPAIFGVRTSYPIGALAQTMAAADLDMDGRKDLVVASYTSNSVYVFPGVGNGYFGASFASVLSTGNPRCATVADFDGNGVPDLAVGDDAGNVRVLANQVNPVLVLRPQVGSFGNNAVAKMIAPDLNGDGNRDLVIAQTNIGHIAVFANDGHGAFASSTTLTTANPAAVVSGDFNHDGRPDLVAANRVGGGAFTFFAGQGNGTFLPVAVVGALFAPPDDAAVLDMNGDGVDDVVAVAQQAIVWRLGVPGSGLGGGSNIQSGAAAFKSITTGEFTGDGRPDVAVVSPEQNLVRIFRNELGTTFVPFADLQTQHAPSVIVARDVDGDGQVDLVMGGAGAVEMFRNMGNGTWAPKGTVVLPLLTVRSLDLADFNVDGVLDVLAATGPDDAIRVLLGGPDLSLTASTISSGAFAVRSVVAGDLTGDGLADGAAVFDTNGGLLLLPNAQATPSPAQPAACAGILLGLPDRPTQALVGDFDNDGNRDVAAVTESGWGSFTRGLPGSPAGPRFDFEAPPGAQSIAALDLDGDGAAELAITDTEGHALRLYRRSGTEFRAFADVLVGAHPRFVIAADLDRDGRPDLATANDAGDATNGSVTILFNKAGLTWAPEVEPILGQAPADGVPVASGPGGLPAESDDLRVDLAVGIGPLFVGAADLDRDGELDLVVNERGGTLSILYALGGGRFHPAQSFAVAGTSTTIADLDGDGRLDVAVADTDHDAIHVLYNTAADPWTTGRIVPTEDAPVAVGAIDLNTDGVPDLAYVTGDGGIFSTRLGTALHEFRNGFACRSGSDSRGVSLLARGDGGVDAYVLSRGEDRLTMTSFAPVFFGRGAETQGGAALLAAPFRLESPYPNPATGRTTIAFGLPARSAVRLGVYDVRGRLVRTLADRPFDAGRHELGWDGRDDGGSRVPPGVYWYRLVAPAGTRVERLVLLGATR